MAEVRSARGARARRHPRWWRLLVFLLLTLAAIEYGVLPSLVAARNDVPRIRGASIVLLVLALLLEVASLVTYTGLTRAVLPGARRVGWPTQLAVDLTGYGTSHVIPGGAATATGLRFRLMTSVGLDGGSVVTTAAVQATLSSLALAGCYLLGVMTAIPEVRRRPALMLTALGGFTVLIAVGIASGLLARRGLPTSGPLRETRTRAGAWLVLRWARVRYDVLVFLHDESRTYPAIGYATVNWLLDAACLWVCLAAYRDVLAPGLVLTAYGFANLLGLLPLTPGGLGVIEGTLIPLLIGFGAAASAAVLGVLTWRLLQFWLPVPVAGVCYLALKLSGRLDRSAERVTSHPADAPVEDRP